MLWYHQCIYQSWRHPPPYRCIFMTPSPLPVMLTVAAGACCCPTPLPRSLYTTNNIMLRARVEAHTLDYIKVRHVACTSWVWLLLQSTMTAEQRFRPVDQRAGVQACQIPVVAPERLTML